MNEKAKKVSIKSLNAEIEKYTVLIEKKKASIIALNDEIKEYESKIKECEEQREQLSREQIQKQIEISWFNDAKISVDQLTKIVELGTKLKDKIEELSIEDILQAVDLIHGEKKTNDDNKTDTSSSSEKINKNGEV